MQTTIHRHRGSVHWVLVVLLAFFAMDGLIQRGLSSDQLLRPAPDPPPEVAADPNRLIAFELAQLRLARALEYEQSERLMSGAMLRLQAAVAYDQAGLSVESQRELALGLRQASSLKFGLCPMREGQFHGRSNLLHWKSRQPRPNWTRVSTDERWVCRATETGEIEVWDLESGKLRTHVVANSTRPKDLRIQSVVFTDDAKRAVAMNFSAAEFWNLETGELIHRITPDPQHSLSRLCLSPDGKTVALLMRGKVILTTVDQPDEFHSVDCKAWSQEDVVSFDSDGRRLLIASTWEHSEFTEILIIDVADRKELFRRRDPTGLFQPVTARNEFANWGPSADEIFVVKANSEGKGELIVQNISTNAQVLSVPFQTRFNQGWYLWDATRKRLIVKGRGEPIRFYDYPTGQLQMELPDSQRSDAMFLLKQPLQRVAYITSEPYSTATRFWSADGKREQFFSEGTIVGIAELPERNRIALFTDEFIRVYGKNDSFPQQTVEMPDVYNVQFMTKSDRLLAIGFNRRYRGETPIQFWDLSRNRATQETVPLNHPEGLIGMDHIAPDRLVTWGGNAVRTWNLADPREPVVAKIGKPMLGGQIFGKHLWTWDSTGTVTCVNLDDVTSVASHDVGPARRVLSTDDGSHILSWNQDFQVTWRTWPACEVQSQYEHRREVIDGLVTADGQTALTWSIDRHVIAWDLKHNRQRAEWNLPVAVQQAALFGENNDQVAILGANSSVYLSQLGTPDQVSCLDALDPKATTAFEALARRHYSNEIAVRQATLRKRADPNHNKALQLVSATTGRPMATMQPIQDGAGNWIAASQFYLCNDNQRILGWSPQQSVAILNPAGILLHAFHHRKPNAGPPDSQSYFGVLVNEGRQQIITGDQSGLIQIWKLPESLPATPAQALLELELRCKYKIDRFGQIRWLSPEELEQRESQLRKMIQ